jgi:putative spermidine/putrescine transport system permease protein
VRSSIREGAIGLVLVLPPFCLLVFVIVVPAAQAVLSTLRVEQDGHVVYSLARYAQILRTVSLYRSVAFTLLVTLASVAATFVLAYTLALYLRFSQGRVSTLLGALFILPLFIPTVIASFAMVTFLQNHGFVATLLHYVGVEQMPPLVFNAVGIVLTEVWASIPFATLVLLAGLQGIDDALIDSARDVGAGALRTFRAVILPLNAVATIITLSLLFVGILGSFTIPYLVGANAPQMMSVVMTNYFTNYLRPDVAVAMAALSFGIAALAGAAYVVGVSRRERGAV